METYYIYQIKCKNPDIIDSYIGSTKHWNARKIAHKHNCTVNFQYRLYNFINNNGGWDNFEYKLLFETPYITKEEAHVLEKQYIQNYKCTLNINKPVRTKEEIKEYTKEYQQRNKDKLRLYMKLYMRTYKKIIKELN
jgi:hypothetical protein